MLVFSIPKSPVPDDMFARRIAEVRALREVVKARGRICEATLNVSGSSMDRYRGRGSLTEELPHGIRGASECRVGGQCSDERHHHEIIPLTSA